MSISFWQHAIFFFTTLCASGLHADVAAPLPLLNHAAHHNFSKREVVKTPLLQKLNLDVVQHSAHERFGSKTAHLMELEKILKPVVLPHNYKGLVPPFLGVADDEMVSFLNYDEVCNIEEEWQEKIIPLNQQVFDKELFLKRVGKIGRLIYTIFFDYSEERFFEETPLSRKLKNFIEPRAASGKFITVRSSGKEDTDTVTNAGGNESKEIVKADISSVLKAMGAVPASYFSQKSFAQRIAEKDDQLFQRPLLSVLIQEVVGEFDGNMVAGGVAYTQENLGNTPGVALVQATHGHCKAVVDSVFPSDTFYLHNDGTAVSLLARKPARFAPEAATAQLNVVTNDKALTKSYSLDHEALEALSVTLQAIHEFYGKPMDVEFVIDQKQKIVWIVQARPLKQLNPNTIPTYINPATIAQLEHNKIIRCTKVNQDDGTVRHITDPKKIIIAHKLDDALMLYLDEMKSEQVKAEIVIVQGNAQATSHAAATLKGCGVAILCTPEIDQIKEMLACEKLSLFIDLQQALIINGLSEETLYHQDLESLTHQGVISLGRFNHPIPSILSVAPLQGPLTRFATTDASLCKQTLQNLVEQLKDGDAPQALEALTQIQTIVQNEIDNLYTFTEQRGLAATQALKKLYPLALNLEQIYHLVHEKIGTPPRSLERLYPIALLEALLFQEKRIGLVRNYSFQSVMNQFQEDLDFIAKYNNQTFCNYTAVKIARLGSQQALTSTIADQWVQVIAQQSEHKLAQKAPVIMFFEKFKILPLFINMMFSTTKPKKFDTFFKSIAHEFKKNKEFFEQLMLVKKEIDVIDIDEWQKPESFTRLFDQLNNVLVPFCTSQEFNTHATHNAEKLSALATLSLMETMISYVDLATKAVKSRVCQNGTQTQEKCVQFKQLLESYLLLLEAWTPHAEGLLTLHSNYPLKKYLEGLRRIFNCMIPSDAQCNPSKDFNVAAAALGSAADFSRCQPQTLEDFFTTIHQSLLNILGALIRNTIDCQWAQSTTTPSTSNTRKLSKRDNLIAFLTKNTISGGYFSKVVNACLLGNLVEFIKPQPHKEHDVSHKSPLDVGLILGTILRNIECFGRLSPSLTGIACTADTTEYTVNIPLRNHSLSIKLVTPHQTDTMRVNIRFYGIREERWHHINTYVNLASKIYDYALDETATILNKNGISFSLLLKPGIDSEKLHVMIKNTVLITFNEDEVFLQHLIKDLLLNNIQKLASLNLLNGMFIKCCLPEYSSYYSSTLIKPEESIAQIKRMFSIYADSTPSDEEILHEYIQALCSTGRYINERDLYQLVLLAQEYPEISSENKTLIKKRILKIMKENRFYFYSGNGEMSKIFSQLLDYIALNTGEDFTETREAFFEKFLLDNSLSRKTCEFPELFEHWIFERHFKKLAAFPELEKEFYRYVSCDDRCKKLIKLFVESGIYDEEDPHNTLTRMKPILAMKDLHTISIDPQPASEQDILHEYIQALCSSQYNSYGKLYQLFVINQTCPEISQEDRKLIKNQIIYLADRNYYYHEKKAFDLLLSFFEANSDEDMSWDRERFFKRYFLEKINFNQKLGQNALEKCAINLASTFSVFKKNVKKLKKFPALEQKFFGYINRELIKYILHNSKTNSMLPREVLAYIKSLLDLFPNSPSQEEILHQYIQELCSPNQTSSWYHLYQLLILDQEFAAINAGDKELIKERIPQLIRSDMYFVLSPEILKYFADNVNPETLELRQKLFEKYFLDKELARKKSVPKKRLFSRKPYAEIETLSPLDKNMLELAKFPELEKYFYQYAFEHQMATEGCTTDFISDLFRQFPWAHFLTQMLESENAINKLLEHTHGNDQATFELFEYLFDEIYFLNESCQKLIIQKARESAATGTKYAWELEQLLEQHAYVLA